MTIAVILAAGRSTRAHRDKLTTMIAGEPLLVHTCRVFQYHPEIDGIVIVARKNQLRCIQKTMQAAGITKVISVVAGGQRRQDSTAAGLRAALQFVNKNDVVLLHNGANPFVTDKEICAVIRAARKNDAAGVGRPVTSTLKKVYGNRVVATVSRRDLFLMETPQGLRADILTRCLKKAVSRTEYTDDLMLAEICGVKPVIVPASDCNRKVTTVTDMAYASFVLSKNPPAYRVGLGFDSHCFLQNKKGGVLGGVLVKSMPAVAAESDGDVVLHAIATALSQAIGGGSLGIFAKPILPSRTKKCNSERYVRTILKRVRQKNLRVHSVGVMVECAMPKIDPLVSIMKKSIAKILDINSAFIGITATSGEGLTPYGKGKGIACTAIVSLLGI